jgi:protein archease
MTPGFEILEHTADIGIRSWGPTLASCFEQSALGLAEILGARSGRPAEGRAAVRAEAGDREGLLVDFLNELLLLHERDEVAFAEVRVLEVDDRVARADVGVVPLAAETETTGVKAATYHGLEVRDVPDGVEARVYLDV